MNGDGVQAVRGDTEAALRELCGLVDAALDESTPGLDGLAEVGPCSHPAAVKGRPPLRAGALGVELPFWLSSRASRRSGIRSTTSRWYSRAISSKSAAAAPRMLVQPGPLRRSLIW